MPPFGKKIVGQNQPQNTATTEHTGRQSRKSIKVRFSHRGERGANRVRRGAGLAHGKAATAPRRDYTDHSPSTFFGGNSLPDASGVWRKRSGSTFHIHHCDLFRPRCQPKSAMPAGNCIEIRDQRSEVSSQRPEIGGQRSEVRGQRSEIRNQKSEGQHRLAASRQASAGHTSEV